MQDATTYDKCSTAQQIRINAVILSAIKNDSPKGFALAMNEAIAEKTPGNRFDQFVGELGNAFKVQSNNKGQHFLNILRDRLAALSEEQIPLIEGPINNEEASLKAQQNALRAVIGAMDAPPPKNGKSQPIPEAVSRLNGKLIFSGNIDIYPDAKTSLATHMAIAAAAACSEKAFCESRNSPNYNAALALGFPAGYNGNLGAGRVPPTNLR